MQILSQPLGGDQKVRNEYKPSLKPWVIINI